MYKIIINDSITVQSGIDNVVINPVLDEKDNGAGTLTYKIPYNDDNYDTYQEFVTTVRVYNGNSTTPEFCGRLNSSTVDFEGFKELVFEGDLALLNDIEYPPFEYVGSVEAFLEGILTYYNSRCSEGNEITIGTVDVYPSADTGQISRSSDEYKTCWTAINDGLLSTMNGHLQLVYIRQSDGTFTRQLNYLKSLGSCSQTIEFGKNLLDLENYIDATNIKTVLVAYGAEDSDEETEQSMTISDEKYYKSAPSGYDTFTYSDTSSTIETYIGYKITTDTVSRITTVKYCMGWYQKNCAVVMTKNNTFTLKVNKVTYNGTWKQRHDQENKWTRWHYLLSGSFKIPYHADGTPYLDDISTLKCSFAFDGKVDTKDKSTTQSVEVDLTEEGLIPTIASGSDTNITVINEVNNRLGPIEITTDFVDTYGRIEEVVMYDDITLINDLEDSAQDYAAAMVLKDKTITAKAVDLCFTSEEIAQFQIGKYVTMKSAPHNLEVDMVMTERERNLNDPSQDEFTFGSDVSTLTGNIQGSSVDITSKIENAVKNVATTSKVKQMIDSQTSTILGGAGGYVYFAKDDNGVVKEIYFMDTDSTETAKNVIRMNNQGIGLSTTGVDGPFFNAWTIDGKFHANEILAESITADNLDITGIGEALEIDEDIVSTDVEYYLSSSATELKDGSWQTTAPTWVNGKYMWSRTKIVNKAGETSYSPSENGTCIAGATGVSSFTFVRYATKSDGSDMVETPTTSTKYIGIYTGTSMTCPTYDKFTWSKYMGDDGAKGTSSYTWIKYADDDQGTNMSDTPTDKPYIGLAFNKDTQTESSDPSDYTWSKYVGEDGAGISSVTEYYAMNTSSTTAPTSGWSTTVPTWQTGYYIWTRSYIVYTTGATEWTTAQLSASTKEANDMYSTYQTALKSYTKYSDMTVTTTTSGGITYDRIAIKDGDGNTKYFDSISDGSAVYWGASKGTDSSGNNYFKIDSTGLLKCRNALVYGTVYAGSGKFEGDVDCASLKCEDTYGGFYVKENDYGSIVVTNNYENKSIEIDGDAIIFWSNKEAGGSSISLWLATETGVSGATIRPLFNSNGFILNNDNYYYGYNTSSSARNCIGVDSSNHVHVGNTSSRCDAYGGSGHVYIYNSNSWQSGSDVRIKRDFEYVDKYEGFFNSLNPLCFTLLACQNKETDQGKVNNYKNIGFVAQEVKQALWSNGLDVDDFAGLNEVYITEEERQMYIKDIGYDPIKTDTMLTLDYTEFIALNTHMIQKNQKRIETLEEENNALKSKLEALEERLAKLEVNS